MTARWLMAFCVTAAVSSAAEPPETPACDGCVEYPLAIPQEPDFFATGAPFKLVDLRYHLTDTSGAPANHDFLARLRVRDWGYFGAQLDGDRRTMTLETHRLDVKVSDLGREWDLLGRYRGPRLIASMEALHRAGPTLSTVGPGWELRPALSFRVARDLELRGGATGDTATPYDHFFRGAEAGFVWQPSARFEASGGYEHAREANETAYENTRDSGTLSLVDQVGPTELSADLRLDNVRGRFPRTDFTSTLGARIPLTPRLLIEGSGRAQFENDLRAHEYRGGITWFGRRFYLPRVGQAAERSVDLARHATDLGENEGSFFDDEGRRRQRERLSLSPRGRDLAAEMAELYHAQVQERAVPLLGFEFVDRADSLSGVTIQTLQATVGVPWPIVAPWRAPADCVPFLRLDVSRERQVSGPEVVSIRHIVALTAALNREMDLLLRWRHAEPTVLEIERRVGARTTLEVSYVYAFGR